MTKIALPHDAYVFVGDGRKALFLRNEGDEKFPNLATERVFLDDNPPTREQGSERPGRNVAGASRRSAVEATDWHDIEEHRFTQRVSAALEEIVRARAAPALVVVAPPAALADLRRALHADVKAKIIGEFDKDLTKYPVWEIERRIAG